MSAENVATARRALDAWNRHDASSLADWVTPDIEFVPAIAASVDGESIRGPEEMAKFRDTMDETWESFRLEADEFREVGAQILVLGRVIAKGRGSGVELDQPMTSVIWFEEGKIVRLHSFLDADAAIEAASGEAS